MEISHGIEYSALSFDTLDNVQSRNSIQSIQGRGVSRDFYRSAKDRNKRYPTKEWIVTVTGNFSYDTRTFNITSVGTTRVTIKTAIFGSMFSPYLDRLNVSSSYSGRTARFDASYTMKSTVSSLLVRETADFGRHTHYSNWSKSIVLLIIHKDLNSYVWFFRIIMITKEAMQCLFPIICTIL